jgi:proteasome-associated ATPase
MAIQKIIGVETEYGIIVRGTPESNPIAASSVLINAYVNELAGTEDTVREMYKDDEPNRFLEVTYQNGDKEVMYFKDFSSGAMIENIVRRAKKLAIKREIAGGERGIRTDDLLASIRQEFKEHEDLPNTTNPDDWAKISGKKGERIVYVRTLIAHDESSEGGRAIEHVATGQYL